jgi:hypothetical protein
LPDDPTAPEDEEWIDSAEETEEAAMLCIPEEEPFICNCPVLTLITTNSPAASPIISVRA